MCQIGEMDQATIAVILALPPDLVEKRLVALVDSDVRRARAIHALWLAALEQGRHPLDLRSAICRASDRSSLEALLTRAVQADQLPNGPCPTHPNIAAIKTAKDLSRFGHLMRNCTARTRGSFGLRDRNRAFFVWNDHSGVGPAMIAASSDQLGWRLSEIKLAGNRPPPASMLLQIEEAFATVGIRARADLDDLLMAL